MILLELNGALLNHYAIKDRACAYGPDMFLVRRRESINRDLLIEVYWLAEPALASVEGVIDIPAVLGAGPSFGRADKHRVEDAGITDYPRGPPDRAAVV